jgi:methyl-accepting chemotaxis protein
MTTTVSSTDTSDPSEMLTSKTDRGGEPETGGEPNKKMGVFRAVVSQLSPRRQYLINRERQLRSAFLVVVVVVLLLVPLNYSLHTVRQQETATITASNPQLRPLMESRDRTELIVGLVASLVIMVGVFALTIIETHRTAGAAYAIRRRLDVIREGRFDTDLHLRGGDNLRELEMPFNAMMDALRNRALEEARTLEELADRTAGVVVPQEAQAVAAKLRQLAKRKREHVGVS